MRIRGAFNNFFLFIRKWLGSCKRVGDDLIHCVYYAKPTGALTNLVHLEHLQLKVARSCGFEFDKGCSLRFTGSLGQFSVVG